MTFRRSCLAAGAVFVLAIGQSAVGDVIVGTPSFVGTVVSNGYGGSLISAYPGTNGPTLVGFGDGFGVTDFRLEYVSTADDIGQTVTIQAYWSAPLGFTGPTTMAVQDFIDFDASVPSGATVTEIQLIAGLWERGNPFGGFYAPVAIASTGSVTTSGHLAAAGDTSFFLWDSNHLVDLGSELSITLAPSAAGQDFRFDFPGSVRNFLPQAVPEPSSICLATLGIGCACAEALRRKLASRSPAPVTE